MTTFYGGIEAGGTKFVCMVGSGPEDIRVETRIPTTTPTETLDQVIAFFKVYGYEYPLAAIGVACFGPLELDPASPAFGSITTTPKAGWQNTPVRSILETSLGLPVVVDTDVNTAALGEYTWGAGIKADPFVYITIGTGIGAGEIINGLPLHGLLHPEMGHVYLPHDWAVDPFPGNCPYHKDCFEGLASGGAISARWGNTPEKLPAHHPAWKLEAGYIALALANLVCTLSPGRIVLGGGIMHQLHLFPLIRERLKRALNGYIQRSAVLDQVDTYIVPPALGNRSGCLGAIALAQQIVFTRSR
jgi:fructokinase